MSEDPGKRRAVTHGLLYFAVYANLLRHPKARELARLMGEPRAWAYPIALWAYTAEFYGDGRLPNRPSVVAELERLAEWAGAPGGMVEALAATGFVDVTKHHLVVHDWRDYQARHVAKREEDRARKRRKRAKVKAARPPDAAPRTEQNRTEQEQRENKQPTSHSDPRSSTSEPPSAGWPEASQEGEGNSEDPRLERFRAELAARLAMPEMGVGRDAESVLAFFRDQIRTVGRECVLADCVVAAQRSGRGAPANLSFFVGWLSKLPARASP